MDEHSGDGSCAPFETIDAVALQSEDAFKVASHPVHILKVAVSWLSQNLKARRCNRPRCSDYIRPLLFYQQLPRTFAQPFACNATALATLLTLHCAIRAAAGETLSVRDLERIERSSPRTAQVRCALQLPHDRANSGHS
ncbi:hypothetical protein OPT61_g4210 [Boeremia exigua]|uniref:Uncharacterized protein n=1 Tax=Boeremia exigua TaxID=749465 RepID=A0ACC2IET2_9PLEO|nr:hypothetical protein OPT61_g4210 [Boeremia exigua]